MPQIPVFDDQVTVRAPGAAHASPEAFAAPWQAVARGAEEFSNQMAAFNERYAEAKRQADAANIVAEGTKQLAELQFNTSQTPDRALAMKQFDDGWTKLRDDITKPIMDPRVKAHVLERLTTQASSRWIETGNAAWGLESDAQKGALENRLSTYADAAARATDDNTRSAIIDDATADLKGTVRGGWVKADWAAAREEKFKSDLAGADVRRSMNAIANFGGANPSTADLVARSQAYGELSSAIEGTPGLTPEHREVLAKMASDAAGSAATRATAKQQHEDVVADRIERREQARNEAILFSAPAPPPDAEIARLAAAGQISAASVRAFRAWKDREDTGRDDPLVLAHLIEQQGDGTLKNEDIHAAFDQHRIGRTSFINLIKGNGRDAQRGETATARNAMARLKSMLSVNAVEQGFIKDLTLSADLQSRYQRALRDWNAHVISEGENPDAFVDRMAPEYTAGLDIPAPSWLARPRFGAITSQDDVQAVQARLAAAYRAKQITQPELENEARLLDQYKQFYAAQAAAAPSFGKRPAAKPPAAAPSAGVPNWGTK